MYLSSMTVGWMIQTNCYLLGDENSRQLAIVDPGDDGKRIAEQIRALDFAPAMILLTHGHFDHVGGVRALREVFGTLPIYMSKKDYPTCPTGLGVSALDGLGEMEDVHFVHEGEVIPLGGLRITVLETPGHSPGGVTYQVEDVLFTGDTLFAGSCGRSDFANSDGRALLRSLKKLADLEGDYKVLPGHMGVSTLNRERKGNPFLTEAMYQS